MMKQRWGLDRNVLRPTPGDPWGVEQHHWSRRKPTVEPRWAKQQTKKLSVKSGVFNMSRLVTKPTKWLCAQRRLRVTAGLLILHLNVSEILYTYLSRFEQGVYRKSSPAVQGIYWVLPRGKLKSPLFLRPLGDMLTNYWCITLHRVIITSGRPGLSWDGGKPM